MPEENKPLSFPEDAAWLKHRELFAGMYDASNYTSPLQSFVMHASHRFTESAVAPDVRHEKVIEIGAGTGEHVPFVRHPYDHYVLTDIDPKMLEIAREKLSSHSHGELAFEAQESERLDYADDSFDRLIATHVLEHIYRPHLVLKEWQRVVRNGGVLSILIPTDPGLAWRLGRHLGPRRKALQQGIAYDYVMAREHVNPCNNLVALMRHYFPRHKEGWWPTRIPAMDLNLFFLFTAINDKS